MLQQVKEGARVNRGALGTEEGEEALQPLLLPGAGGVRVNGALGSRS